MTNVAFLPEEEAYIWGFPLVSIHRTRLLHGADNLTGTLHHVGHLATPRDRRVVAPNNDTLYSSGWYDLRYGDLLIRVPPMDKPGRYWNVMVVDAYTHISYITRRQHGVNGAFIRVTFDPTTSPDTATENKVRVGTPTAWVIVRILVESEEDLSTARNLQTSFEVITPELHPQMHTTPGASAPEIGKAGAAFFPELMRYMAIDPAPPCHPTLSEDALRLLENLEAFSQAKLAAAVKRADTYIRKGAFQSTIIRNGWSTGRAATGPGKDIARRARGAMFGLGGHYAVENRSYIAVHDVEGQELRGERPLELRFTDGDLPPCEAFWSLTAYGPDLYLVDNEINRWSIGDRSQGLEYDVDGSLRIVVSASRPHLDCNWLPVPHGSYKLGLRVYEGTPDVVECRWFPPPLTPMNG